MANSEELKGKVAIVTGASRGIGRAIALAFVNSGAKVAIASRNKYGELDEVVKEIKALKKTVLAVPTHLGSNEALENLVAKTKQEFGRIDILVNNAATNPVLAPIIEIDERAWDQVMNINLKGCFLLSQKVAKVMIEQKGGCIINIASIDGFRPPPGLVAYSISKAGVIMLSQGLAKELGQYGIRVIALAPGLIRTKFSEALWSDKGKEAEQIERIAVRRLGKPEEIANVVAFLASDKASYLSGTTVVVDGGKLTY